ncbi:MAG TPA: SPW repeat protein [Cyclobacteriaceae bacterium]|nr:SPW repeat protein [Cyclobacteriaceae bacterium]
MIHCIVNMLLGIWLMVSPDILDVHDVIADNYHIIGPLVVTFSVIAMSECTNRVILVNVPLGVWLLTAPWILSYESNPPIINDLVVGGVIVLNSVSMKRDQRHQYGGGWRSLFR